ncbi:MAG: A24 family peptidase C-terminal domain-containing protein [Thermoprotei archaeon]
MVENLLLYIRIVYSITVFTWFSIYDLKYREIPDKYVWIALAISTIFFTLTVSVFWIHLSTLIIVYTLLSLIVGPGLFYILYLFNLIGKADVFAVFIVTLLLPYTDVYSIIPLSYSTTFHLPPILPIILYSAVLSIIVGIAKSVTISLVYRSHIPRELPLHKKIVLLLIGKPMRIGDYLRTKHYYPLSIYRVVGDRLLREYRLSFNVEEEDYRVHQEEVKKLIEKGYLSPEDYIWVTYGIPYLVPLLAGLILFLIIGDTPLILLFFHL